MKDWRADLLEEHGQRLRTLAKHRKIKDIAKKCGITRDEAIELKVWLNALPDEYFDAQIKQRDRYTFNAETQTYVFHLHGAAKAVVMSAERVDQIVSDYSNLGAKASLNQIARENGIARPVVRGILKALGPITHDSLPFTQEVIDASEDDELIERARELRQAKVYRKIEREKWRDVEKDAQKLRKFEEFVLQPLKTWMKKTAPAYAAPVLRLQPSKEPFTLFLGITDEHFGKPGPKWTGAEYNRDIQKRLSRKLIPRLFSRIQHLGRPEQIIVPVGSDGLHFDRLMSTPSTTRGTPMSLDGDASPRGIVAQYVSYKVEQFDLVSQFGNVSAWFMPGNHDELSSIFLTECLRGWFSKREDITVSDSTFSLRAELYGETLIATYHGHDLRVRDLGEIIPKRFPKLWGRSRFRYCFTGHYHTERELPAKSDITILRMPSFCGTDEWHFEQGYSSRRALNAYIVEKSKGVVATFSEPVLPDD